MFNYIKLYIFAAIHYHFLMTKEERHQLIIDTLMKHESIQVSDLSSLLDVSTVTIRKDLTELEKAINFIEATARPSL